MSIKFNIIILIYNQLKQFYIMNITFIGNCQTVSLCFYFQQLLSQNNNICWLLYGDEFRGSIGDDNWSMKCKNKILDYNKSIQKIKDSDIIIYQNIDIKKSLFSNTDTLCKITKNNCKLIKIPCIYLIYNDFDNSIKELLKRENDNNVDIQISKILYNFRDNNLMLTHNHPNTFLFMEIIKLLCNLLNFNFFTDNQYNNFLKNNNYMNLPIYKKNKNKKQRLNITKKKKQRLNISKKIIKTKIKYIRTTN